MALQYSCVISMSERRWKVNRQTHKEFVQIISAENSTDLTHLVVSIHFSFNSVDIYNK